MVNIDNQTFNTILSLFMVSFRQFIIFSLVTLATPEPLPTLAQSFTTELELTHQEDGKLKVVYGAEAFDRILNKGVLRYELSKGERERKLRSQNIQTLVSLQCFQDVKSNGNNLIAASVSYLLEILKLSSQVALFYPKIISLTVLTSCSKICRENLFVPHTIPSTFQSYLLC